MEGYYFFLGNGLWKESAKKKLPILLFKYYYTIVVGLCKLERKERERNGTVCSFRSGSKIFRNESMFVPFPFLVRNGTGTNRER